MRTVTAAMLAGRGDELPVSALPADGTYPSGTARYEKRNISDLVAVWDPDLCIQCGNCSFVCSHSVIRSTFYPDGLLEEAPEGFESAPLVEFSGACAGCGETPYLRLLSQLFGDRLMVANATGCSSIYGGSLPTTPWTKNGDGRGPAWSNSLFEDNGEFGLGFRLAADQQLALAQIRLRELRDEVGAELADAILAAAQRRESEYAAQRACRRTKGEAGGAGGVAMLPRGTTPQTPRRKPG